MIYIIILIIVVVVLSLVQGYLVKQRLKPGGYIVITENDGKKLFSLELEKNPDEIERMKYIVFKVVNEPTEDPFAE